MKNIWLAVLALAAIGYGCGPRLAETPYGQKEMEWKDYVGSAYPSWAPPQTVPPIQLGNTPPPSLSQPDTGLNNGVPTASTAATPALPALPPLEALPPLPPLKSTPAVLAVEQTYVVQPNDSFWKIAKKFYNDGDKWQRIKDANQDVLHGRKLQPRMKLRIPAL